MSSPPVPNLYEVLDILKTSNDEEIKKAYKKMALKYHPDRNINNKEEANTKFQEINRAYQTLSDPEKRKRYDQFGVIDGVNNNDNGMASGFNPMDIFNNMFGNMGANMGGFGNMAGFGNISRQDNNRAAKSPDKKVTINISLTDVYKGKVINIDFSFKSSIITLLYINTHCNLN